MSEYGENGRNHYKTVHNSGVYPNDNNHNSRTSSVDVTSLQSESEKQLLDVIEEIRGYDINHEIELPQLVVCGKQSSGKSSVLEAISKIPFPRKNGICTRFATV